MISLFDKRYADKFIDDPLAMRVYTSRLLGKSQDLVLHGGGNTSLKLNDTLFVKGSGWDLSTIEKEGFSPVELETLLKMATLKELSDTQMVKKQKEALKNSSAPNPSIEAILHAIIPFKFVDHTHADAVVTLTNTPFAKEYLKRIYSNRVLIIEYIMPGFPLAKTVYEAIKNIDFDEIEGIILLNHGIFTFDDNAQKSYEKMISLVNEAEKFLEEKAPLKLEKKEIFDIDTDSFIEPVSKLRGKTVTPKVLDSALAQSFSRLENLYEILHSGPLTPEHVIRTKAFGMLLRNDFKEDLNLFTQSYKEYFDSYAKNEIMQDLAPRWCAVKNKGVILFGCDEKENLILSDIISHTMTAVLKAQKLGGWKSLHKKDIFAMEYWELEQAKLKSKS